MSAEQWSNLFVNAAPFLLYGALLFKLYSAWRRVRSMEDRCRETRLAAVLLLLTVCTLTFMAANAYALEVYGKTFLSLRVFQMFVLSNCAAYWLVLDLITKDACE
ncbi:hypothetical protein [Stutzerimonas stutzeri]|uniref:Uncharacterized protein n=1 Tax=Stutzerimonas stutzeri TaxID=316 RepID=A0AA42TH27_STUST|nr:hypothetical protein [Stutzerimonas stutzeri]MDH1237254.1 hypothetical protein [Stutzerimonas stutzeri]